MCGFRKSKCEKKSFGGPLVNGEEEEERDEIFRDTGKRADLIIFSCSSYVIAKV